MTIALTTAGVQQVSITIASGSLTGTASISSVGSGAFLIYQGMTTTETSSTVKNDSFCYLSISGTTITATRGATGTSISVTVNAAIIDGDTTNLIKSVQTGTVQITTTNTTGTVTISAVTNANTAVGFLGQDTASSLTGFADTTCNLTLSSTTLTATRVGTTSGTINVAYCIIEFQGSALNSSVQNLSRDVTGTGLSGTITVTSVTTANSMVVFSGQCCASSSAVTVYQRAQLTSATQITVTWEFSTSVRRIYKCCVVEFVSGLLSQSVQRGTITLSNQTSNTATITSAPTAETLCNWLLNSSTTDSTAMHTTTQRITQTNATTLTQNLNTAGASTGGNGSYEVIDFVPAAAAPGTLLPFPWMQTTGGMQDLSAGMRN